jgi:hypothetical protein
MAYTYERTISETANGVVDAGVLKQEIIDASLGSATVQYITTDSGTDSCDMVFDVEPSAGDKTTVNGILANHEGVPDAGTLRVGGGLVVEDLADPSAPTVAAQGTGGSTTWGYKVTAFSDTGETLASTETQIADGNATLSATNHNLVSWAAVAGAVKYGLYRITAGGTPSSTGLVRTTPELEYQDIGAAASGSAPSEDLSGALVVGTGTVSSSKAATIKELTSDQSTATSLLRLARRTSGTAAAGFGTGIYLQLDDAGGTLRDVGSIHFRWDDPAAGTLHSCVRFQLRDGGTGADKSIEWFHDGKMEVLGDTVLEKTTCAICWSPGEVVIGQNASVSSNNDVQSITFDDIGDSRARWNTKPPKNYVSGDLTMRCRCSVAGSPGSNSMRLGFKYKGVNFGSAIPAAGTWDTSIERTESLSEVSNDEYFNVDFTIASGEYDANDETMAFHLYRDGDHAGDTTTLTLHIHLIELRYTGWAFAGQAGQ